jgi:ABC-type bacteriocin/lantibiotic exporter with double-glycine peptidase domain
MRHAVALLAVLLLNGCLYRGAAVAVDEQQMHSDPGLRRIDVPLVRQDGAQDCGAAAVAALLAFWDDPVTQAEIRRATRVPAGEPIAAGALQKYLSERGYENFLVTGTLSDLRREIATGRPAIVGMLKPYAGKKYLAHYEVVTAVSPKHVYTMNPARSFERYPIQGFEREWRGAKRLTLFVAPSPRANEAQALLAQVHSPSSQVP